MKESPATSLLLQWVAALGMSLINNKKSNELKTLPCGTPDVTSFGKDVAPFTVTYKKSPVEPPLVYPIDE